MLCSARKIHDWISHDLFSYGVWMNVIINNEQSTYRLLYPNYLPVHSTPSGPQKTQQVAGPPLQPL